MDITTAQADLNTMLAARQVIERVMEESFKRLQNKRTPGPRTNTSDEEISIVLEAVDEAFYEERKLCESIIAAHEDADAREYRKEVELSHQTYRGY